MRREPQGHLSRFDIDGQVLQGPATKDLLPKGMDEGAPAT